MINVLLDNDLSGRLGMLDSALQRSGWAELQLLQFVSFDQVGLASYAIDREVWRTAQASGPLAFKATAGGTPAKIDRETNA